MKYVGHEHIVMMYDAYFEGDDLYVVMELCRGDDLFQWLCDRIQMKVGHIDSTDIHEPNIAFSNTSYSSH
jgi:serine/threonine protein kinase